MPDLNEYADRIEVDRHEPDKILCHVQSMRSAALAAREEPRDGALREALNAALYALQWIADHQEPGCAAAVNRTAVKAAEDALAALVDSAARKDTER